MNKNEEEFGVVITANTNPIKKAFKDLQGFIKGTGKQIEESSSVSMEDADKKASKFSTTLNKLGNISKKVFEAGSIGAKIFAAGILSIGAGILTLANRYTSIYSRFNEQFRYQSELTRNTIALSLAPVIEFLGNIAQKVAIFIGLLAESLFGINVFGNLATQGIMNYNKQLKQSKSLLGGIDEITNLSGGTGGLGSDIANQFQALANFQKEVDKMREKLSWLTDWIKENKNLILWLVGSLALGKLVSLMGSLSTIGIITIGVTAIITGAIELHKMLEELRELEDIQKAMNKEVSGKTIDAINEIIKRIENSVEGSEEYNLNVAKAKELWNSLKNEISQDVDVYTEHKSEIDTIANKLTDITNTDYKIELDMVVETAQADKDAQSFFGRLSSYFSIIKVKLAGYLARIPIIGNFKNIIGGYADGLDYVPYDEYPAVLHKGEAVVPAKYNPTIHSQGNDYTNALLETLVTKMDDLSSRPNVFEIDGRQFASATYPLYRTEEARNNYNGKVSVKNG